MLGLIKKLFGGGQQVNLAELAQNGAQIIDVRTKGEFDGGHIKGSINIPLQNYFHSLPLKQFLHPSSTL